jgi:hypothetical protein
MMPGDAPIPFPDVDCEAFNKALGDLVEALQRLQKMLQRPKTPAPLPPSMTAK